MPVELLKPDNEQLIPELLAALRPKSCKIVPAPDLNSASFNLETSRFGQQIYIVSDSFSFEEAKKQITGNGQLIGTKNGYHIISDGKPAIEVIYLCLIDIIEWKKPVKLLLNKLLGNENWEMVFAEKCSSSFSEYKSPTITDFGLLKIQQKLQEENNDEKELKNKEKKQVEVWLTPVNQCIPKKVKKKVLRKVPKKTVKNGLIIQNNNDESNSSGSREQTPSQTTSEEISIVGNNNEINGVSSRKQNGKTENSNNVSRIANKFNGMASGNINNNYSSSSSNFINQRSRSHSLEEKEEENVNNSSFSNRRFSNPTNINGEDLQQKLLNNQQPIYLEIPVQLSNSPPQTKENKISSKIVENGNNNNNYNNLSEDILTNNEDGLSHHHRRPSLTESPPPRSADSDSPNSLSYVSANADIIPSSNRRPWRREDAPSPSKSLILQNARRNVNSITPTNQIINGPSHRLVTPLGSNLSPISSCGSVEGQQDLDKDRNNKNTISCTDSRSYYDDEEDEDESTLMLLNKERRGASADDGDELTIMSSIREDLSLRDNYHSINTRNHQHLNGNNKTIRGRHGRHNNIIGGGGHSPSPPPRNSALSRSVGSRGALSRSPSAAASHNLQMVRGMLGTFRMSVPALQQILGLFSFKEIGILRRVHPHWDELAGQLLNVAHFRLIQRAQHLLTDCQRRVNKEPRMAQPVKLLTRLHVHALNPVDGMRAFMDEGVLCFPYGAFLDQAFSLLSRIDLMIENNFDEEKQEKEYKKSDNLMDKLAEITRKAVLHYKQWVEPEAEKRMSELYRVSAQQRLQRIDSFLVESSVSRVEREAKEAENKDWEIEQLKQQNNQLKKESRDLRQLCQRLDQRVDVLERKFKTMARLLQ
uniref:Uncharacterized protein n=1 Tax=Meloidogyne hapla TaxID=6305 RepID=A0A1I8BZR0_MELHA